MQRKIRLKDIKFIELTFPSTLRLNVDRYITYLLSVGRLDFLFNQFEGVRVIKVGRAYYAFDQFILLSALKEHCQDEISFTILKYDDLGTAIDDIVSQITFTSIASLEVNYVSSFEKYAAKTVGFRPFVKRKNWASILPSTKSNLIKIDRKFRQPFVTDADETSPSIDLENVLNTVPVSGDSENGN